MTGAALKADTGHYGYWPYQGRPKIRWPGNARVAFWVASADNDDGVFHCWCVRRAHVPSRPLLALRSGHRKHGVAQLVLALGLEGIACTFDVAHFLVLR